MGSQPPGDREHTESVTGLVPSLPATDLAACKYAQPLEPSMDLPTGGRSKDLWDRPDSPMGQSQQLRFVMPCL